MKKEYFSPEMEEFKYEMPALLEGSDDEAEGGQSGAHDDGGDGDSL